MPSRATTERWAQETRFLTGMDEHSAQVEPMARQHGKEPKDLVDEWADVWRAAFDRFDISYDRFIRTTDPDHVRASIEMVTRAQAAGDIYKGTYAGWYCPGDNEFKTDAQLVDGHCPDHPTLELQWLEEENYFFALSRYQERLEQLFEENPGFCEPEHFRNEVLGWLREGLRDFSVSRAGGSWGIPFPGDPEHRIYVWFDALTNYVTGAGFPDDRGHVRALLAGRPARHRQEHHPLPLPLLAGHADERRPAAAAPGLRPRLHAAARREDVQDARQRARSGQRGRPVRRGRRALPGAARDPIRPRRATSRSRAWSAATTPTWPTTSATCSTARSAWPTATWTADCRAWSQTDAEADVDLRAAAGARLGRLPGRHASASTWTRRWPR